MAFTIFQNLRQSIQLSLPRHRLCLIGVSISISISISISSGNVSPTLSSKFVYHHQLQSSLLHFAPLSF
jgi:hypothetical protein